MQFPIINGFVDSICRTIAMEQIKLRSDSEEVLNRTLFLSSTFANELFSLWEFVQKENDINAVTDTILNYISLSNSEDKSVSKIDQTILFATGLVIGSVIAGYTPMILSNEKAAADIRLGEMWFAQELIEDDDGHYFPSGEEKLLVKMHPHSEKLVLLRWSGGGEPEPYACILRGYALPNGFRLPLVDLSPIRNFIDEAAIDGGHA